MNIKQCFILGAGKGTRMGPIGKKLPKILWPIFEKTLLELQMSYAMKLGCEHFYLNAHHLHDEVIRFIEKKKIRVTLLYESELLDSAGAFYNLKRHIKGDGKFLYLNGDILYFFEKNYFKEAFLNMQKSGISLFGLPVKKGGAYNQTLLKDQKLIEITPPPQNCDYYTYAGMGLIDLEMIDELEGPQKFFSTLAHPKKRDVFMTLPKGRVEYWDFGTKALYRKSLEDLFSKEDSQLFQFLVNEGFINRDALDIKNKSYFCDGRNCLNFSDEKIKNTSKNLSINLGGSVSSTFEGLHFKGLFDNFS